MKRRVFLRNAATTTAGAMVIPTIVPSSVFGASAPSNKINIGQIGCGRIAVTHDMPGTMQHDVARMVAVSDLDSIRMEKGKKLVEDYYKKKGTSVEVKMYADYKDMLADKDIDAVVISTPDHWHSQPAIEAALAGKDIYLQKPTSLTVSEGRLLSDIVNRQGTVLQVGTQQRSSSQFLRAAELVRNGRIGKIHTVKIGLPGDPGGPVFETSPVPSTFNFDMWLGSTPEVEYKEKMVHPQHDYSRPGWLRNRSYGAGMITGWGQHHYDIAAWGMDTEYTGPISVEAVAQFPKSGDWNVHGDFMVKQEYANGATVFTSGGYPNGIRFEGEDGWVFVTRGAYRATPSDPIPAGSTKALDASSEDILKSVIGDDETKLYVSHEQHGNWLDCIQSRKAPISPAEISHRTCTICLISDIAMQIPGVLEWDPAVERFKNNDLANSMLSRPQRYPYGTDYIKR
ncbi:Gfo/Idh/MocA family protein [Draconibacterium sediminis]|uniref:Gfo/Idh/MocA family protein n=1 Tax=Draconibacterium sediminis TaxID=1544798 RepID=UPI0026F0EB1A|nr:Gfo/Idh/MocA family oxidoreductase [Draconibacterium sediminis]